MTEEFNQEKREFTRIDVKVPVQYRFMSSQLEDPALEKTYEGETSNISGGGLLLEGRIPELPWVPELLMNKMKIAVQIEFPEKELQPIEALTRVAWIETIDEYTLQSRIGLTFTEITSEDRDRIFDYVIREKAPEERDNG